MAFNILLALFVSQSPHLWNEKFKLRASRAYVGFIDRGFSNLFFFFDYQVESLFSILPGCGIIQAKSWVSVAILRPLWSSWEQKSRPEGTNSNRWYLADTELGEKVGGKEPDGLKNPSSS